MSEINYMNYLDYIIRIKNQLLKCDNIECNNNIKLKNGNNDVFNVDNNGNITSQSLTSTNNISGNSLISTNNIKVKNGNDDVFNVDNNGDITCNSLTSTNNISGNSLISNNNIKVKNGNNDVFNVDNNGDITCNSLTSNNNISGNSFISTNNIKVKNNNDDVFNVDNNGNITCNNIDCNDFIANNNIKVKNGNDDVFNVDNDGNITCNNILFKDSKYKNNRCIYIDLILDLTSEDDIQLCKNDKLYIHNGETTENFTKNYIYEYNNNTFINCIIPEDGLIAIINSIYEIELVEYVSLINKYLFIYLNNNWIILNIGNNNINNIKNGSIISNGESFNYGLIKYTVAQEENIKEINIASGKYSHAEGSETTASGLISHAEGSSTEAKGNHSHAEGLLTKAIGDESHAEGYSTEANNDSSHVEGWYSISDGIHSHAEGHSTHAKGKYSHSEGYATKAIGDASHSSGINTIADKNYMFVVGKNNIYDEEHTELNNDKLFVVGNGTYEDTNRRSDAFVVKQNETLINTNGLNNISWLTLNIFNQFYINGELIIKRDNDNEYLNMITNGYQNLLTNQLCFNHIYITNKNKLSSSSNKIYIKGIKYNNKELYFDERNLSYDIYINKIGNFILTIDSSTLTSINGNIEQYTSIHFIDPEQPPIVDDIFLYLIDYNNNEQFNIDNNTNITLTITNLYLKFQENKMPKITGL